MDTPMVSKENEQLRERFEKLCKRLNNILINAREPITLDENAYWDLLSYSEEDYHDNYIYQSFEAKNYFYNDLPEQIRINQFYCGEYFKGGFPDNFECYEIFLGEYSRVLPDGFTCLMCHVGPYYNLPFPENFHCNYLYMEESKNYDQPIPPEANIEYIFINNKYYHLELPENYILDEESTAKCTSSDISVYKNQEYEMEILEEESFDIEEE